MAVPITPRALGYLVARYAHLMGHDSLDTARIYVASTRADLQEAVETIDWQ